MIDLLYVVFINKWFLIGEIVTETAKNGALIIDQIISRQSRPKLGAPAPSEDQVKLAVRAGIRAPDHGKLRPWRFVALTGDALTKLGEAFIKAKEIELGELTEQQEQKFKKMPTRAPLILVALAEMKEHPKVPPIEQVIAVGCAVQNMQLAFDALGFGSMWRTGDLAFNEDVKRYFDLAEKDQIVGFLYVGTPEGPEKELVESDITEVLDFWN